MKLIETDTKAKKWGDLLEIDWRLNWYEICLILLIIPYAILQYQTILPYSAKFAFILIRKLVTIVGAVYAAGSVIVLIKAAAHCIKNGRKNFFKEEVLVPIIAPYFSLNFLMNSLRRVFAILAAIFFFLHLKLVLILIHPENFDLFFWNLDRTLHFGIQPNIWAMEKLGEQHSLALFIDWIYIKYFSYKTIVAIVFLLELWGRKLTDCFFTAYVCLWMVGGLLYLATPADGPCYAGLVNESAPPETRMHVFKFPALKNLPPSYVEKYRNAKIWNAKNYQEKLWRDRYEFLSGKKFPGVFYGIAAMPSLHVAAVTMIGIFLLKTNIIFGFIGIVFGLITFVGSIFLQWHYAVDGYVGFIMALLLCLFSLKLPARKSKLD